MNTETTTKTPRFKAIKSVFQMNADHTDDISLTLTRRNDKYVVFSKSRVTLKEVVYGKWATLSAAMERFDGLSGTFSFVAAEAGFPVEYKRKKTGRKIPCPGEAHSNPHIDHCGICLPGWGEIDELAEIDFEAAKNARQDIPLPGLTSAQYKMMEARSDAGECVMVGVDRRNSWYNVYRWI